MPRHKHVSTVAVASYTADAWVSCAPDAWASCEAAVLHNAHLLAEQHADSHADGRAADRRVAEAPCAALAVEGSQRYRLGLFLVAESGQDSLRRSVQTTRNTLHNP